MRHFEYYRLKRNWEFVWDCYQGSDAVKRGKNARIYLPMLRREREEYERSGKTRAPHYELRKSSASYENLFKPVVDDIVGIMQKNAPTVKFGVDNDEESPEEVRAIRWYGNQYNDGVTGLKHRLNFNQTLFGRYGLLLDIVTDPQGLNPKFCITEYSAPKILDGEAKKERPDRPETIRWILLDESTFVFNRQTKDHDFVIRWRVLGLDSVRGFLRMDEIRSGQSPCGKDLLSDVQGAVPRLHPVHRLQRQQARIQRVAEPAL